MHAHLLQAPRARASPFSGREAYGFTICFLQLGMLRLLELSLSAARSPKQQEICEGRVGTAPHGRNPLWHEESTGRGTHWFTVWYSFFGMLRLQDADGTNPVACCGKIPAEDNMLASGRNSTADQNSLRA